MSTIHFLFFLKNSTTIVYYLHLLNVWSWCPFLGEWRKLFTCSFIERTRPTASLCK